MATKTPQVTQISLNCIQYSYTAMANGDDGAPISAVNVTDFNDRSVQVSGTFGVGGNLKIEGTNETGASNYATLNNAQSGALDITAAGVKQVIENTLLLRPRVSAGDGTTNLNVTILLRRNRSGQESA